jgi:hypothetical protein
MMTALDIVEQLKLKCQSIFCDMRIFEEIVIVTPSVSDSLSRLRNAQNRYNYQVDIAHILFEAYAGFPIALVILKERIPSRKSTPIERSDALIEFRKEYVFPHLSHFIDQTVRIDLSGTAVYIAENILGIDIIGCGKKKFYHPFRF